MRSDLFSYIRSSLDDDPIESLHIFAQEIDDLDDEEIEMLASYIESHAGYTRKEIDDDAISLDDMYCYSTSFFFPLYQEAFVEYINEIMSSEFLDQE